MNLNRSTLSAIDQKRLMAEIETAQHRWVSYVPQLDVLRAVVHRSRALPPAQMPPDVITMNSRFLLENMLTGEWRAYALVYPAETAIMRGRISVLSPAGTALLGARVGQEVSWKSTAGVEVARVQKIVHQPEAMMLASPVKRIAEKRLLASATR